MGRYGNIKHELTQRLHDQDCRGQSKHAAKAMAKAEAQKTGKKYLQPTGIYSTSTMVTYSRAVADFSRYATDHHRYCRTADDARRYVDEYHAHLRSKGISAWSVRTYMAGVMRAYGMRVTDLAMPLPSRRNEDITRSDRSREYRYKSPERRAMADMIRDFCRATGCREGGLSRLRWEDLRIDQTTGNYEVYRREKGGKAGWYPTVASRQSDIDAILRYKKANQASMYFDMASGELRLFSKAEYSRINVHACRDEYAAELYAQYTAEGHANGDLYRCRGARYGEVYDKGILAIVSHALAHERLDVVVSNYLRPDLMING